MTGGRKSFTILGGNVRVFRVPLRTPFITALGSKRETVNVGLELRLRNGAAGYGEASGSVVLARLKPSAVARLLRRELRGLIGQDARRLLGSTPALRKRLARALPAAAAVECALNEAVWAGFGTRLCERLGGALESVETDITLSAAHPREAAQAAGRHAREGFRLFKVKVGTRPGQDLRRVLAVWRACRGVRKGAALILDGNQGLSPDGALRLVEACLKRSVRVTLLEQPLKREKLESMRWLKTRCPVPVAADEGVRSAREALEILDRDAADVINVKVAKTGIAESLDIMALTRSAGKKLMAGCMQETARGLSPSVHLACGTGAFDFVDLDSDHLLDPKQPGGDFVRRGARLRLERAPGATV